MNILKHSSYFKWGAGGKKVHDVICRTIHTVLLPSGLSEGQPLTMLTASEAYLQGTETNDGGKTLLAI